jgi:signal transduction histidine kinase/HAMP domain-containing protein
VGLGSLLLLGIVGLVGAVGVVMNRLVVSRLGRLSDAALQIGGGDFSRRIDGTGGDEIGRLGGAFNDMAESLQRFTQKIEADRDFLDRLINSIEDEIVVFDRELRVVAANRAAGKGGATGGSCEGVCRTRGDTCCKAEGACIVSATFEAGQPQRRLCSYQEDGIDRHIEVVTAPIREEGDRVVQVVCFTRDITERRMMETELIRSERLASLGRLAAGVAHQINNPLASIAACAEGLQRRLGGDTGSVPSDLADLPEYLETIRSAAYEGKEIAGQLLNLSRSEEVDIRDVQTNEIVAEVVSLLKHRAESQGKALKVDLDADLSEIQADRTRIAHALSNLIQNGLDAADAPEGVKVRTRAVRNGVQIEVEDRGCGIEGEALERIFEPFYTTKPPGEGTGLGLSISERTIRDHGGSIAVESRPGEGTQFTVFLPGASQGANARMLQIEGAQDG